MHEFPDIPMGACLGEYCPKQTNSIGETEGADAIRATARECMEYPECVLDVVVVEVKNA